MDHGILTEVDGAIGIVTLNRPDQYNAFDDVLARELTAAISVMENDPAVSVVVLSSVGSSFCSGVLAGLANSGGDVDAAAGAQFPAQGQELGALQAMLEALARMSKPMVARVHGSAFGLGAAVVALSDIAIATFDAQFTLHEVRHGIAPALASPHLIGAIGARHTRRYMLTGESLAAAEAYRLGLVHEIVPDAAALDTVVGEIVDALLRHPQALSACKRAINAARE